MIDQHSYMIGYQEGFADALRMQSQPMNQFGVPTGSNLGMMQASIPEPPVEKKKRKPSAYNKRLGKAIKDLTKRHKLKSGKWRKGWSQKRMMKAAHKAAKR